jgi:hypothetical protein
LSTVRHPQSAVSYLSSFAKQILGIPGVLTRSGTISAGTDRIPDLKIEDNYYAHIIFDVHYVF